MSGSTIGGIVGGVIGFVVSGYNPQGFQIGYLAGSLIGGYVDPDVIKGPKIGDGQVQTSSEGIPRPIIYGTTVIGGNIIQRGELIHHTERDRGKGGPVQETDHVSMTFAIRICEGEIGGVLRVWADDKLVMDRRDPAEWPDDAEEIASMAADTAKFLSKCTIYTGSETQEPDPSLEALPEANGGGLGNVPAYRGTAYAVFDALDLTSTGARIPQFRWEVSRCGIDVPPQPGALWRVFAGVGIVGDDAEVSGSLLGSKDARTWDGDDNFDTGADGYVALTAYLGKRLFAISTTQGRVSLDGGYTWRAISGLPDGIDQPKSMIYHHSSSTSGEGEVWLLFYFGQTNSIFRSFNGLSFTEVPVVDSGNWHGSAISGQNILVGRNNTQVYRSLDGGQSFEPAANIGAFDAGAVSCMVATPNGFTAFNQSGDANAATTQDNGETWATDAEFPVDDAMQGIGAAAYGAGVTIAIEGSPTDGDDAAGCWIGVGNVWTRGGVVPSCTFLVQSQLIFDTNSNLFVYTPTNGDRTRIYTSPDGGEWTLAFDGGTDSSVAYSLASIDGEFPGYVVPDAPGFVIDNAGVMHGPGQGTVSACSMGLDEILEDQCFRVGIRLDQIDVTAAEDVTVRGLAVAQQMRAADVINSCRTAFFGDYPEFDRKLRWVPRGGAVKGVVTDDDFVDTQQDDDTRGQVVEFPLKINVAAADKFANYEPAVETFARRTDNVKAVGELSLQLPFVMTRDEVAQVAEKAGKVIWTEAAGRWTRELPPEFWGYTPTDCFTHNGQRLRINKTQLFDGSTKWDAVRDRASNYESTAAGTPGVRPTAPIPSVRGPTRFWAFNAPSLRSADNVPGIYLAAQGMLTAWAGCRVFLSTDDGETFSPVMDLTSPATLGVLDGDIGPATEPIPVQTYGRPLETITAAQLAARRNGFAVGFATPEIGQFKTADETSEDHYDLTDTLRGQLGTVAASHGEGENFVLLDEAVRFLKLDISLAGKTLIFRAVTFGTAEENNPTFSLVFQPQFTGVTIESYTNDAGEAYSNDDAQPYYKVT